ncbi:hypothetical protein HY469_04690 [Candidatus Roizmanbacteria bacterium]|nr:hypothetical protein [Candidatus Roizmanbacteria bacterium]
MSNKSIPSEVFQGVADLAKDTAMAALEAGSGGLVKKQTPSGSQQPSDTQVKEQIEKLRQQEEQYKEKNIPSVKRILEGQEMEKQIIAEENEERRQEKLAEIQREHQKKMGEQVSSADALAATGHHKSAPDLFARKGTKEDVQKSGM